MIMKAMRFILPLAILLLWSCEKDKDFKYDLDKLIGTRWGIPQVEEVAPGVGNYDQSAPTVFYEDGRVSFGDSRFDTWEVYGSKSLHIFDKKQIWQVISLSENELHVEKLSYPNGNFILRCKYYPMTK